MEYFDVYDADGRPLNKSVARGTPLEEGEFFMVIHVWIERADGKFLIQKRAKTDDPVPHQWAITSGLASQGESPRISAVREVREEIGLSLKPGDLEHRARILSEHNRYHTITHVYHTRHAPDIRELSLDEEEVLEVAYVSLDTILDMVSRKAFWDYDALLGTEDYFSILKEGER